MPYFGSAIGAESIVSSLEGQYKASSREAAPAIVVLGGGLVNSRGPAGTRELGPNAERLWTTVELYRAGKAPLILISSGNVFTGPHLPEAVLAGKILRAWEIPASDIILEDQSTNTHENAVFSQRILAGRGITRILLVTSAFHMPRAVAAFKHTGLTVLAEPTDYITGGDDQPFVLSLLPSAGALNASGAAIKEWLGLAAYRLRGWAD